MRIDTKEIQPYTPLIIYIVLSIVLFYFLSTLEQDSNMILAVTTLLSGTLIIYTYVKQKLIKRETWQALSCKKLDMQKQE